MLEKSKYKPYSQEFKDDAVLLVLDHGYGVSKAAEAVGVRENMLYRWKKQYEERQQSQELSPDEKKELLKLRKEVKRLRMEREILKKASAFFAKELV